MSFNLLLGETVGLNFNLFRDKENIKPKFKKRRTCRCTIKQLCLSCRNMRLSTRKRTVLTLCAPVNCATTMYYGGLQVSLLPSHTSAFFWSLQTRNVMPSGINSPPIFRGNNIDIFVRCDC